MDSSELFLDLVESLLTEEPQSLVGLMYNMVMVEIMEQVDQIQPILDQIHITHRQFYELCREAMVQRGFCDPNIPHFEEALKTAKEDYDDKQ